MNIYDIAKLCNVSIATVSRVVNKTGNVSDKTREKVQEVIDSVGYTPNAFAQGLGLGSMNTIGIICTAISDLYMANSVGILQKRFHDFGYQTLLCCTGFKQEEKESNVQLLLSKNVDALILIGSTYVALGVADEKTEYIRKAAESVPVFLINGKLPYENVYSTYSNDFDGTYSVTTSLFKKGITKIAFLYNSSSYSANQKLKGYEQAHTDNAFHLDEKYKIRVKTDIYEVKNALLNTDNLPIEAIITSEDVLAIGAIKYAEEKNLSIPKDISIVGYNNSFLSLCSQPELTSIDNRVVDISNIVAEKVYTLLHKKIKIVSDEMVACQIIKRNSTNF